MIWLKWSCSGPRLAQAQLIYVQDWPRTLSRPRQGLACPLDSFALGSEAKAEHVWGEPEPILRLSMTILDEPGSDDLPHRRCLSFDQVSNSGSPSCSTDVCQILTNAGKLFWAERNEAHGFSLLTCRTVGISKCWQVYWKPPKFSETHRVALSTWSWPAHGPAMASFECQDRHAQKEVQCFPASQWRMPTFNANSVQCQV